GSGLAVSRPPRFLEEFYRGIDAVHQVPPASQFDGVPPRPPACVHKLRARKSRAVVQPSHNRCAFLSDGTIDDPVIRPRVLRVKRSPSVFWRVHVNPAGSSKTSIVGLSARPSKTIFLDSASRRLIVPH